MKIWSIGDLKQLKTLQSNLKNSKCFTFMGESKRNKNSTKSPTDGKYFNTQVILHTENGEILLPLMSHADVIKSSNSPLTQVHGWDYDIFVF
ncbi:hypothetical protein [Thermoactinomyces sp. DSM 45892]|uniref:hypothetical protein n=1 Tax=Thermoactinomyces sp. DSM 45892 TaxID=1882753 RepID=UPI00089BB1EA|nr:hypothetical protein [Thermoactinomyces sp. DSM 45892]SDX92695.1 hypothetical protein SAMN05444416_10126 [Thermoactinomyces sp. DSM 45892]